MKNKSLFALAPRLLKGGRGKHHPSGETKMRVIRTLAAAGVAALVASVASASPIVTTWNYTVGTAFDTSTTLWDPNPPSASGGSLTNTPSKLAWGIPGASGQQSSLVISNSPASDQANKTAINPDGELVTAIGHLPTFAPGEIGPTQIFTHNNFTIKSGSNTLDSVTAVGSLMLSEATPGVGGVHTFPPLPFGVNFKETVNFPSGNCVDNTPKPCADIFVISGGLNLPFWFNSNTDSLSLINPGNPDFVEYFIQIFPFVSSTPLTTLSPDACAAAGAPSPCQGFKTEEGQANNVQFAFSITTQPISIPEPGMLGLLAAGLVGLGFVMRRRQA
jgi:hypothetical protein